MQGMTRALSTIAVLALLRTAAAESVSLPSVEDGSRTIRTTTQVTTQGKVFTNAGAGKKVTLELNAKADFAFTERRLPSGGRDAMAFRAVRDFAKGSMQTTVGDRVTNVELAPESRIIVASGHVGGITNYSPQAPLTRETLDLLEIPGDPLALSAIMPVKAVSEGESWTSTEWAAQMLGAVEAVEKAAITCKVTRVTAEQVSVEISGGVTGQREGANCGVQISGTIEFNRSSAMVTAAKLTYSVKSAVGAVSPGIEAQVDVQIARSVSPEAGRLSDQLVASIPISPGDRAMDLVFDAAPWGVRLHHGRDWYLFHAVLEGSPQVAILRLIDRGSMIAQCNVSPIASVSPGQTTPLNQFEGDIRKSLGDRLKEITAREQVNVDSGVKVFRVVAQGQYTLRGAETETTVPTHWIYYLCTAPDGRQASFVFAVETQLLEQLGSKDEELVRNMQFVTERSPNPVKPVNRTGQTP